MKRSCRKGLRRQSGKRLRSDDKTNVFCYNKAETCNFAGFRFWHSGKHILHIVLIGRFFCKQILLLFGAGNKQFCFCVIQKDNGFVFSVKITSSPCFFVARPKEICPGGARSSTRIACCPCVAMLPLFLRQPIRACF